MQRWRVAWTLIALSLVTASCGKNSDADNGSNTGAAEIAPVIEGGGVDAIPAQKTTSESSGSVALHEDGAHASFRSKKISEARRACQYIKDQFASGARLEDWGRCLRENGVTNEMLNEDYISTEIEPSQRKRVKDHGIGGVYYVASNAESGDPALVYDPNRYSSLSAQDRSDCDRLWENTLILMKPFYFDLRTENMLEEDREHLREIVRNRLRLLASAKSESECGEHFVQASREFRTYLRAHGGGS